MATARIVDSFWTCAKRRRTEVHLARAGHVWPTDPARGPMSAAECIARLLAFLDGRGDPTGSLAGVTNDDLELEAGWTGTPGVLAAALDVCGWIDETPDGRRWHDFGSFNSRVLTLRANASNAGRTSAARRSDRGPSGRWGHPDANGQTNGSANGRTNGQTNSSGSSSGSSSESESESRMGEQNLADAAAGAARPRAPRRGTTSPTGVDSLARPLSTKLGASLGPCRKQIAALRLDGWTDERIAAAIEAHGEPGLAPWDWTKRATGTPAPGALKGGTRAASILAWGESDGGRKERA